MATDWEEKASFMRSVAAVHAEWGAGGQLTKLVLGSAPHVEAAPKAPKENEGPIAKLMRAHEVQFASSRFKPQFKPPPGLKPDATTPRAVREKQEREIHGQPPSK